MSIKVKLEGFDKLLEQIEASNELAERASESAIRQCAQIMQEELKSAIISSAPSLDSDLANELPNFEIQKSGNTFTAKVGFKGTAYTPNNLSSYFKAIFANYGTAHGERPRGFVSKAKKRARPKIKKAQKEVIMKIVSRLK